MNDIDIALGVGYPYLSETSVKRLIDSVPGTLSAQFTNPRLKGELTDYAPCGKKLRVVPVDNNERKIRNGILFRLYFPSCLTASEQNIAAAEFEMQDCLSAEFKNETVFMLRVFWFIMLRESGAISVQYKFYWSCHPLNNQWVMYLNSQVFSSCGNEPWSITRPDTGDGKKSGQWLHVRLDLENHVARVVLGDPIYDVLPKIKII